MEHPSGFEWWSKPRAPRRGLRYRAPLLEIVDVERGRATVTVEHVPPDELLAVATNFAGGMQRAEAPRLPVELNDQIAERRERFGTNIPTKRFEAWMEATERGDADAALAPFRKGTLPINALLRSFGVAYMQIVLAAPSHALALMTTELLALGADPNALGSNGQGVLHLILQRTLLRQSLGQGPLSSDAIPQLIEAWIAAGARPRPDVNGSTPLHFAMLTMFPGDAWLSVIRHLVRGGADPNAIEEERGRTPLHLLADAPRRRPEGVELLLSLGAELHRRDRDGATAYDLALLNERGSEGPISVLLSAAKPDTTSLVALELLVTKNAATWTPPIGTLGHAIDAHDMDALQALLDDGVDPDGRGFRRESPLRTVRERRLALFESALLAAGASRDEAPSHIAWSEATEETFAKGRAALAVLAQQLASLEPDTATAVEVEAADAATERAIRAHPTLVEQRVGGRTVVASAATFGLARTLTAIFEVAPPSSAAVQKVLLEASSTRPSLDAFRAILRGGADPLDRGEFMSVFRRVALDGRIEALLACLDDPRPRKLLAREARGTLKLLTVHGHGRSFYVAGFLRQLLLAIEGRIDGVSVDTRSRAHDAPPDSFGVDAYFADVNRGVLSPDVVAVRAAFDVVVSARSRGRVVVPAAHTVGVPWVPRAEVVVRLGESPWTLLVASGARPESPAHVARELTESLGVLTVSASMAGPLVHRPGVPTETPGVGGFAPFCREERLWIPALEVMLDLGIVSLAVRGVVEAAVTNSAVIIVSHDRWLERSSASERAVLERLAHDAIASRDPGVRRPRSATR